MISNMYAIYHFVIGFLGHGNENGYFRSTVSSGQASLAAATEVQRRLYKALLPILSRCHVPFSQPGFLSTPSVVEAGLNETILVPCLVHDLGKNVLRWWKDGTLLSDTSDDSLITPPRITQLTNNMLLIDSLEPGDAGNYTCEIIRAYPRLPLEQVHVVRVKYPPSVVTLPSDGYLEAVLGTEVQMGCMASGYPPPVVIWKFKGVVMKELDNRHKLIFKAEDPEQSGLYLCEASNKVMKSVTGSIVLRIIYAPEIKVEKTWVHSSLGMKIQLECFVKGEPAPKLEWLFRGETLKLDSSRIAYRVQGTKHILSIRNLLDVDFGEYVCKARNKVGEAQQTIELSGLAYPAVFKKTRGLVSPDSYSLIWEVDSYSPIIEYKLLFKEANDDGKKWIELIIPADANSPGPLHSKSYTISGLKLFTVYQAQLISRNRFGWSEPSDMITFGSDGISDMTENEVKPVSRQITGQNSSSGVKSELFLSLITLAFLIHTFPVNL